MNRHPSPSQGGQGREAPVDGWLEPRKPGSSLRNSAAVAWRSLAQPRPLAVTVPCVSFQV